ncbi:MAG: hypothetical protein HZC37_17045 [Burkholderiales bacterium]|nr:hypothetical protein [Burkholderiales bacterium]
MTAVSRARTRRLLFATLAAAAAVAVGPAQAGEIYLQAGLPGVGLGYAQPLSSWLGVRGDFVTLGTRDRNTTEEGIAYQGKIKTNRGGLYADLFPFAGGFRFTLGATSNDYKLNLDASGTGSTINVGGTNYTLGPGDGLGVEVKFPSTTPYVGFGWGHQAESGLRFSFDLGASIGKAKVTVTPRGQLAQPAAQADVDRETAELRDGVGKVKGIPQLSFAIGYSF